MLGARSIVGVDDFGRYDFTLRPDASRYELETYNLAGNFGWGASLARLIDIGVDAVAARIKLLTDRLALQAASKGFRVVSPRHD